MLTHPLVLRQVPKQNHAKFPSKNTPTSQIVQNKFA